MLHHMQSHNLGTHTVQWEDINMPNGFNNPYITTTGGEEFDINALIQYLTDIGWDPSEGVYTTDPDSATVGFNVNLPTYGYQGMSPEIMQALGNVFTVGDEGFNPEMFGEDFITSQIQEQLGGLTEEDLPGWMSEMPGHMEGLGTGGSPSFDPTIESIGDWDYGDMQSALGFTNIFDPESIAATLSQLGGMEEAIRPGEVKALTPEMIEKTTSAYYDPYETAQRGTLVDKLSKQMGKVGTGGFAGSGGRQAGLSGAEKLYQGGYQDILGDIMKMRGGATENVLDTIYGWSELMSA